MASEWEIDPETGEVRPTSTPAPTETPSPTPSPDDSIFGDFRYRIIDNSITITGLSTNWNAYRTVLTIPAEIDGAPVKAIGNGAFKGQANIVTITLPETLESIGAYVFSDCDSIVTMDIPDSVVEIGEGCFLGCNKLNSINPLEVLLKFQSAVLKIVQV